MCRSFTGKNALGNHTLPAFELHAGTTGCPIIKEIKEYVCIYKNVKDIAYVIYRQSQLQCIEAILPV